MRFRIDAVQPASDTNVLLPLTIESHEHQVAQRTRASEGSSLAVFLSAGISFVVDIGTLS